MQRRILPLCRGRIAEHSLSSSHRQGLWLSRSCVLQTRQSHNNIQIADEDVLRRYKSRFALPRASCTISELKDNHEAWHDREVILYGYLGTRRTASKCLTFAELHSPDKHAVLQVVEAGRAGSHAEAKTSIRDLDEHIPVIAEGVLQKRHAGKAPANESIVTNLELKLHKMTPLNSFDKSVIMKDDTVFPPEQRYLQMRNDSSLYRALAFRSKATSLIRKQLCDKQGFIEVETPLLFKSTPEGAREFLVPTRTAGLAYALPQSPQQYKQILMAGAVPRYMQIARCFRDEDLRADRQPEFTQVDLEMAFASSEDVMEIIELLVLRLWKELLPKVLVSGPFPRMTYQKAMSTYGSDKPDTRYGCEIRSIDGKLPRDLISKISVLDEPIVEAFKISIADDSKQSSKFVRAFMESPEAQPFLHNSDGQPGIFIIDSTKPLKGLQPFGFEAADEMHNLFGLDDGDCLFAQARPRQDFQGGYTMVGNLRLALNRFAVARGYLPQPEGFAFLWVIDFPLFTPSSDSEPGQGGAAGLFATHHPFTAPKTAKDVDMLLSDPLSVKADHYDLVVNGVELGGGSRRIHDADMQELVMRRVLQMSNERINDFKHLLAALRAGCPPHAGIALGLDRLVAVMLGRESVRDVIAFPKSGRGEDLMVGSPSPLTSDQLSTYHLQQKG